MLDTYIKNRGMTKTIVHNNNQNTINETNWDADYDGNIANVSLDLTNNGRNKHLDFKFTNNDLANLLTIPSVRQPIHKRIKMDFMKPESSFDKIFLELDPESSSDSDSDSESDYLENMGTIFDSNTFNNNPENISPIQELLTHISSPKSNEEFIMPFQDYSLQREQPVIKVVHRPNSRSHKSRSKSKSHRQSRSSRRSKSHKSRSSRRSKSHRQSKSHKLKHHNYPSKRKSPRHRTSRRS